MRRRGARLARYAAPAAFLVAATIAILIVRSGLDEGQPTTPAAATTRATSPATTNRAQKPPAATTTAAADAEFYEIQPGDTLALVADAHGTTVEALLTLNPDLDPVALRIGERIRVK